MGLWTLESAGLGSIGSADMGINPSNDERSRPNPTVGSDVLYSVDLNAPVESNMIESCPTPKSGMLPSSLSKSGNVGLALDSGLNSSPWSYARPGVLSMSYDGEMGENSLASVNAGEEKRFSNVNEDVSNDSVP